MRRYLRTLSLLLIVLAFSVGCSFIPESTENKVVRPNKTPEYLLTEERSDMEYGHYAAYVVKAGSAPDTIELRKRYMKTENDEVISVNVFDGWQDEADIKALRHVRREPDIQFTEKANKQISKAVDMESYEMLI